jgi:hypothetical protein
MDYWPRCFQILDFCKGVEATKGTPEAKVKSKKEKGRLDFTRNVPFSLKDKSPHPLQAGLLLKN